MGGDSGAGSVGALRRWKWRIIKSYAGQPKDVLDVGCGDLRFWKGRRCRTYLGIDISKTIIERDRLRRPDWNFQVGGADILPVGRHEVVLCLDLLFHIMDDFEYLRILDALAFATGRWLFVYTWSRNPFRPTTVVSDGVYQTYRDFLKENFSATGLGLVGMHGNRRLDPNGAMYVLRAPGTWKQEVPTKRL